MGANKMPSNNISRWINFYLDAYDTKDQSYRKFIVSIKRWANQRSHRFPKIYGIIWVLSALFEVLKRHKCSSSCKSKRFFNVHRVCGVCIRSERKKNHSKDS